MQPNGALMSKHDKLIKRLLAHPELHKRLVSNAMNEGKTLHTFVKDLLQRAVSETYACGK